MSDARSMSVSRRDVPTCSGPVDPRVRGGAQDVLPEVVDAAFSILATGLDRDAADWTRHRRNVAAALLNAAVQVADSEMGARGEEEAVPVDPAESEAWWREAVSALVRHRETTMAAHREWERTRPPEWPDAPGGRA